jgi:hypothetical protein
MSETPIEYGCRLKQEFAELAAEIDLIISSFNSYVYGQRLCDAALLGQSRHAIRKLYSPLLWPKRLKSWFVNAGG